MAARVFRGFVLKAKQSTHKISRQLANTAASHLIQIQVDQQLLRAVDLASGTSPQFQKGKTALTVSVTVNNHGCCLSTVTTACFLEIESGSFRVANGFSEKAAPVNSISIG